MTPEFCASVQIDKILLVKEHLSPYIGPMRRARLDRALLEKKSVTDGQQLLEDNVLQAIMDEPDSILCTLYKTK